MVSAWGGVSASASASTTNMVVSSERKRSFMDEQKEFGWSIFLSTNGFYFTQGVLVDGYWEGQTKA